MKLRYLRAKNVLSFGDEEMSHLATLIQRFRRDEANDEIPKGRLVNLAEYMTYYRPVLDFSLEEMEEATKILQEYRMRARVG